VPRFNAAYLNLNQSYLFAEIRRRTKVFTDAHPDVRLIDLGVGDVTQPLPPAVIRAMHEATDEMARRETFKGYGPYVGYEFLRAEIAAHDFGSRGVKIAADEVFVSDGGKSDSANLQEIFAPDCVIAVMDPVYPVYADSNVVAGRTGRADAGGRYAGIVYLPCTAENNFQPALPDRHVDVIYLCYPNNPTGAVVTREALTRWVEYAGAEDAVILYDAAYEAYIAETRPTRPTLRTRRSPTRSTRSRARARWRSSAAAFPRMPASPACAWRTRSCRRRCADAPPMAQR
jgi:LL-diaminopimelate aminotransferase